MLWLSVLLALATFVLSIITKPLSGPSLGGPMTANSSHVPPIAPNARPVDSSVVRTTLSRSTLKRVHDVPLAYSSGGEYLLANVTFGTQTFVMIVDTGSADTWVVVSNFTCVNDNTNAHINQSQCDFKSFYNPSSTFHPISDENFNILYEDGDYLNGFLGTEQVEIGGISVLNQTIAVVNLAGWDGDGHSSGILGLSYPTDTNAYPGSNFSVDTAHHNTLYDPIFTSMWKQNLVSPVFSFAIKRITSTSEDAGLLALGGLPEVPFHAPFVETPIVPIPAVAALNLSDPGCYSIVIEGLTVRSQFNDASDNSSQVNSTTIANMTGFHAVLDTGTPFLSLPLEQANLINSLFSPPATYIDPAFGYNVTCSAVPPVLGVKIGGEMFYIKPEDLIYEQAPGWCQTNVLSSELATLGIQFFWNTMVVMDVAAGAIRVAARPDY